MPLLPNSSTILDFLADSKRNAKQLLHCSLFLGTAGGGEGERELAAVAKFPSKITPQEKNLTDSQVISKLCIREHFFDGENMRRGVVVAALAAVLLTSMSAFSDTPFVNGSFEKTVSNESSSSLGWVVPSDLVRFLNTEGATDGSFAAAFNPGSAANGGTLSQTFSTIPGERYFVSFDWGSFGSNAVQRLKVEAKDHQSGQSIYDLNSGSWSIGSNIGVLIEWNFDLLLVSDSTGYKQQGPSPYGVFASAPNSQFSTFRFSFTAISTSSTLLFSDVGTGDLASSDGILDNIRVVPEAGFCWGIVAAVTPIMLRRLNRDK